jgi:hypothetical protein
MTEILMGVVTREPAALTDIAPETPFPVAFAVDRCLRKDPGERYRTAGELHAALEVLEAAYGAA